ncbi:glyoxalase [Streptococcus minor]|uniref:Glyoxalase n=1 Tax=Streptococcus minor TaxID=229549 RepID=A0A3P1VEK9_9STRE|nr:glyoxalase [Streptococcus minor]RRD32188.1 glyoxalase [Streptococcus minor]
MKSLYPVIMTQHLAGLQAFFVDYFGFEKTFVSDWYISLRLKDHEIAFLLSDHETIPQGFRQSVQGVLVNIEVEDISEIYKRIQQDIPESIVLTLRDEDFGQRHFIVALHGVLIDVIQEIEPSDSFKEYFQEGFYHE